MGYFKEKHCLGHNAKSICILKFLKKELNIISEYPNNNLIFINEPDCKVCLMLLDQWWDDYKIENMAL